MSLETVEDFSFLRAKRRHENISTPTVGASRCGEIFVTSNADKWSFFCSYCQKATNDIGVFICHIRLDHLSNMQDFQQERENSQSTEHQNCMISKLQPMTVIPPGIFPDGQEEQTKNNLIKEETFSESSANLDTSYPTVSKIVDISSLTDSNETDSITKKGPISPTYPSFTIAPRDHEVEQELYYTQKEIYKNNEKCESNINQTNDKSIIIHDDEHVNDQDTDSLYSRNNCDDEDKNENVTDFESKDDTRATSSKRTIATGTLHNCEYCDMDFKFRSSLDDHLKRIHNLNPKNLPLRCKQCKKIFRSVAGLKNHLRAHDEKTHKQCPICQVKHNKNYFITHVLTHESNTCFPCQVCGKIYTSKEERVKHWKTHAREMPFNCEFCYRRFRKQQYLTHHLKSHFQYQCQFCPTQFNAVEHQKAPYVCTTCENMPDIKKRVQHHKLPANKYHVLDSDEDSTLTSNPENDQIMQNYSKHNRDSTEIENENNDLFTSFVNSDDYDMVTKFANDINDDIGTTGSETKTSLIEDDSLQNKCDYCQRAFKFPQGLHHHIAEAHDKNYNCFPFKCRHCSRGFKSRSALCSHQKTHDKSKEFKCPACSFTDFRENCFITHVMTHEHDTCFPCQVCAKIFPNNDERKKHYKMHIKERPHGCNFCYRRFHQKHILISHLKTHGQYKCYVCPKNFKTYKILRQPYICPNCEEKPNLASLIENRKSLSNK